MNSLTKKKNIWDVIKKVGALLAKCCIGFGMASGATAIWMGAAKAAVTTAAFVGAGIPVVVGGAAFVAGAIMVAKLEKEIERTTPHLSAADLKKLIPAENEPNAPALAAAPDLGKEFTEGVENVQPMKTLRFKPQPNNNQAPTS